jgi:hypothetical protein
MTGTQVQTVSLVSDKGHPALFTHLARPAWQRLVGYFGTTMDTDLYKAILYIRVASNKWSDQQWVKQLTDRSPRLANRVFFDVDAYEGTPLQRLAAALAWAIATHRGEDPNKPSADLKAVAFCLAEPMTGGELRLA